MTSASRFEARKWAYRQTKEGTVVSFLIHPNDLNSDFAVADLGTRYMVAFAKIGDDEQPIAESSTEGQSSAGDARRDPPGVGVSSANSRPRQKWGKMPLSQRCGMLCADKGFQDWLLDQNMASEGDDVAVVVRHLCGVLSRSELDEHPTAAERWRNLESRFLTETGRMAEQRT